MNETFSFLKTDGGAKEAGYTERMGDCVVRSFALAMNMDYEEARQKFADEIILKYGHKPEGRKGCIQAQINKKYSAQHGIQRTVSVKVFERFGWRFVGYKGMKLDKATLPKGLIVVAMVSHYVCMIDHEIYDSWDSRGKKKTKTIRGYWTRD